MITNDQLSRILEIPEVLQFSRTFLFRKADCEGSFLLSSKRYGVLFSELFVDNMLEIFVIDFDANLRLDCDALVAHYLKNNLLTNEELAEKRNAVSSKSEEVFLSNHAEKLSGLLTSIAALSLLFEELALRDSSLLPLLGRVVDKSWTAPYRQCASRAVA